MEQKTCYYCGTKYPFADECCPLCGQTEIEPEAIDEAPAELNMDVAADSEKPVKGGARTEKRSSVISTIICILLAIAVLAGALFIMTSLGVISFEREPADETSLTLPVENEQTEPAEIFCTGIDLAPENAAFNAAGSTVMLLVSVEPSDCTETLVFESADESVATVSAEGLVTAVGTGTTEITVSCGEFAKSMEVVCDIPAADEGNETVEVDPATLSLSLDDFTLFAAGETASISVLGLPEGVEVLWTTSNEAVATVEDGLVTAVGGGNATVSAAIGDTVLKCIVRCGFTAPTTETVTPAAPVEGDSVPFLSHDDVTVVPGETFVIRLVQNNARVQGVTWSSSNPTVCSVGADGMVTALGTGNAKVIGTYDGVTYTCIVRCS